MIGRLPGFGWRGWVWALATVILAAFATRAALAFAFQDVAPEFVLRIDPGNPVAKVRLAQSRAAAGDNSMTPDRLAATARESIRALPLNAGAFRLFAATSEGDNSIDQLGERMAVAHRLTRRDLGTELFLIEDAVRRNDVAGALDSYDSALRVGQSSRTLLYPVLTEAMREPLVRQRFVSYMQSPPPWLESFLRFAVSNSSDPASMVRLAALSGGFPDGEAYASIDTELLTGLVERKQLVTAVNYFRSLDNAKAALLTDLAMNEAGIDKAVAPVSWQAYSIPGIDAVWIAAGQQLELEALLDAGYVGPIARKLLALSPGTYRFSAPFRAQDNDPRDTITWSLTCPSGQKIVNAATKLVEQGRVEATFTVPAGCPVQTVLVSATTAPGSATVAVTLTSPSLSGGR